jgi:hypothetical protein
MHALSADARKLYYSYYAPVFFAERVHRVPLKGVPMKDPKDLKDDEKQPIKDDELDKVSGGTGGGGTHQKPGT